MKVNRRDFIKKMSAGAAGLAVSNSIMSMPAKVTIESSVPMIVFMLP